MSTIVRLKERIKETEMLIDSIQEQCSHPEAAVIKEYKGSSGNYDPAANGYWIIFLCETCEKQWTKFDDDLEGYNSYPNARQIRS